MIEAQAIQISLKENIEEKLYIEVTCMAGEEKATAIISGGHTNFVYLSKNDSVLMDKRSGTSGETEEESVELNLKKVYDFATTSPIEELQFILEARRLNKQAAERSFEETTDTNWVKPYAAATVNG